jgi:hypothetical protein
MPPLTLAALPHALAVAVFERLTPEEQARCATVCRAWRSALQQSSLWLRLDLSRADGGLRHVSAAALKAAAGRASGQLQSMDLSRCSGVTRKNLIAAVAANAGALRELRLCHGLRHRWAFLNTDCVAAMLRAAPLLRVLDCDVACDASDAQRLLRNEAPFGPLRVRLLCADFGFGFNDDGNAMQTLLADAAVHESLTGLRLKHAPLQQAGALDEVVDTVVARQLACFALSNCDLVAPAAWATWAPALARVINDGVLTTLAVEQGAFRLDYPAATLVADALRGNTTLTSFSLSELSCSLNPQHIPRKLVRALVAHRSLRSLSLNLSYQRCGASWRVALGALVRANSVLEELLLLDTTLGDWGLGPLLDALPANTRLRTLGICSLFMSAAFARQRLLPAIQTNTSLRLLTIQPPFAPADAAEALVRSRTPSARARRR